MKAKQAGKPDMATRQYNVRQMYLIMYGKKPIAVFKSHIAAQKALESLRKILPAAYAVTPRIERVPLQG